MPNDAEKRNSSFVPVYSAQGQLEAETVKAFLESFNITAVIYQESVGVTFGFTAGPLGAAKVLVPQDQADEAVSLLNDMEAGKFDSDEIIEE